jgi:hypothetical protein
MKVWIVKHIPTDQYLPPVKSMRGTTSQELSDMPRVFYKKQYAVSAARWWAKGTAGMGYTQDWETGINEPMGVESRPVEGRKLSDLRIYEAIIAIVAGKIGEEIEDG